MKCFPVCLIFSVTCQLAVLLSWPNGLRGNDAVISPKYQPRTPIHVEESGTFRQQFRTNYSTESGLPEGAIHRVAEDKTLYAATEKGIASFSENRWKLIHSTSAPIKLLSASHGRVGFVQENRVFELLGPGKANALATIPSDLSPASLLMTEKAIYLGTAKGLFAIDGGAVVPVVVVNQLLTEESDIRQLAAYSKELAIAASGGLVSYDVETKKAKRLTPRTQHSSWAPFDVRGVGFDSEGNLCFASPQGVGIRTGISWKLYTGYEGLPYNDFTCVAAGANKEFWFGTSIGAIRFSEDNWEYRQGPRWLADDNVNSIAVTSSGDAWFATPVGVTRIEPRPMTLREKAAFFNTEIDHYHRRTPYGYVDAIAVEKPGDKSNGTQHDSDNDGLWTSMYGAAQCFEYAVTRSAESKKRADDAMRAIAFLSEVTQGGEHSAPYGFPARTILPTSGRNPNDHDSVANDMKHQMKDPLWKVISPRWPISADKKWYWKTDTSSDELDGHYFFYALYYDLVAETDEQKRMVVNVVDRITTHLVDHDMALVDHDGKPTRWGRFGPEVLNTDVLTDCRGLNSVSVLSYLAAAIHVTGNQKFQQKYEELLYKHHYFTNVLNAKHQNGPGSGNQSDDEMALMCYYNLFAYEQDPKLRHQYMRSLARYFSQEESETCPLFNLIFASFYEHVSDHWDTVPASVAKDSVNTLQRYPLDRFNWGYRNSHRLDIVFLGPHIVEGEGKGHQRNGKVLPIDERFVDHWNNDPWRLNGRGNGKTLADGTSFLLPYWLGVHHGFIKETSLKPARTP